MKKILSFVLVLSMLFSMVSFAIPAAEVVESANEVVDIAELASDDVATLTSEYGDYMIYSLDFEGTNAATIANGYINDLFGASSASHKEHFGDSSSIGAPFFALTSTAATIGTEGSNHYLVVAATDNSTGTGKRGMVDFQVRATNSAPTGKYTFVAKVFIPSTSNMASLENIQFRAGTANATATNGSGTNKKGQWITVTQEWDCTGAIYANRMQFLHKASDASTAVAYVDDVQLWYTAPAVASTVTFDANGVDAILPTAIDTQVGATVDLTDVVATTAEETKRFKGWSITADGEIIKSLEITETAYTLYAVWETVEADDDDDNTRGDAVIYNIDFTNDADGTFESKWYSNFDNTNYKDFFTDSNGSIKFNLSEAGEIVTIGGNKVLKLQDTSAGANATTAQWSPNVQLVHSGTFNGAGKVIVQYDSYIPASEGSVIADAHIRYKVNNVQTNGTRISTKNAWVTHTLEFNTDEGDTFTESVFYFMNKDTTGNSAFGYVDNIKVSYIAPAPTSTITFDVNGNAAATPPSPINMEIGLAFNPSQYVPENTDATKEFAGWATSANGDVVYTFTPSEAAHTLYAVWTTPFVLKDGYIMNLDFEDDTVSANAFVAQNVVYDYSNFDEVDTFKNMNSDKALPFIKDQSGAVYITEYNGNKVLEVTDDALAARGWAYFNLGIGGLDVPGTYRISFKYLVPTNTVEGNSWAPLNLYVKQNGANGTSTSLSTTQSADWYEVTKEIVLEEGETLDELYFNGLRNSANATTPGSFYLDDIKILYIMPKNGYNLTFDVADKYASDVVLPAATKANETGATELWLVSEPVANDSSLVFKGWSLTENGAVIESVTPTQDTTLYAIFEERIHPFFSDDFSTGKNILGGKTSGEVNFYSLTSSIANGIYTATLTDTDTSSNQGAYGYWFNDVTQNHKYVTADTPLVRDDIKGMSIKYKILTPEFNGSDSFNAVPTPGAQLGENKTDVFAGPANTADSGLKNVGNKWHTRPLDTWYYINMGYADTDSQAMWAKEWPNTPDEIGTFRFDILQQGYDGMQFQVDYVKFILADNRILPTLPAETEMALDGDYAVTFTYPQGLNVTEDEIAPDAFGKYAINFEFVADNQIKVYVNPAYAWAGNVVPVKSPGFMNAEGTMTYVTTYYNMAFETLGAPTTIDAAQIRTDAEDATKQGMRYAAYIETAVEACEYGFIVALESSLDDGMGGFGYDMFVMDDNVSYNGTAISGTNASGIKIVGAVAITGTGAQTIYSTTGEEFGDYAIDDGLYFTTVLTGIPLTMKGVSTRFIGRPYVKLTDGTYVHGAPITRALIDIANEVIANTEGGMANCDMYIKNIFMASMGMFG